MSVARSSADHGEPNAGAPDSAGWGQAIARIRSAPTWSDAILPTLWIHGLVFAFAALAWIVFLDRALPAAGILDVWLHWDARHFLEIARYGYGPPADPARIVLFPLFPLLIAVGSVAVAPLASGMAISLVAHVAAAVGLYRLVRLDHDRRTARHAVVLMSVFPTAFVFVAAYSEALFLALAIWAMLRARQDDWRSAGWLALLASLTRIQGVFLLPALAVEYGLRRRRLDRDAAWLALGLLGPVVYLAINFVTFGDPLHFIDVQSQVFKVETVAPWDAIGSLVKRILTSPINASWITVSVAPLVALVVLALVAVWSIASRRSRPAYATYALLSLASFATLSWPISVPRYILGVFPMFIWLGWLAARRGIGGSLVATSSVLLAVLIALFVQGRWAF